MPVTNYDTLHGEIIAEYTNGVQLDYLKDALGSVTAWVDQNCNIVATARYKPFGDILVSTGTLGRFTWVGTLGYRSSGLTWADKYVRARHYGSKQGQWTTVDPLWPTEQAFGYARGQSTSTSDQSGLQKQKPKPKPRYITPPHQIATIGHSGDGTGFTYGAYCGSANVRNPAWRVLPQSCVDACCLAHDRCLEANQGAGRSNDEAHTCCDADLGRCAEQARTSGCCDFNDIKQWVDCIDAARLISQSFRFVLPHLYPPEGSCKRCLSPTLYGYYSRVWWGGLTNDVPRELVEVR